MNNASWLAKGSISVIAGCMYSGKTEELLRRIRVLQRAQKKVLIFKSKIDNRYRGISEIVSHDKRRVKTFLINKPIDMINILKKTSDYDAIAIDEIQFLDKSFLPILLDQAQKKKIIICAGLDGGYWNKYNSLMSHLLVEADLVDKLFSVCSKCNGLANRTQRIKNGKPVSYYKPKIMVGGVGQYEARCKFCNVEFLKK